MSEQAVINPLKFALEGASLDGAIAVARLDRLHDVLRKDEGAIQYSLQGGVNPEGKPTLTLSLAGSLTLECQRCLNELQFPVQLREELIVAKNEKEMDLITSAENTQECILARDNVSVPDLVEDEILLELPISARHRDCAYPARA